MKLRLAFSDENDRGMKRPLTNSEINEMSVAACTAENLVKAMGAYLSCYCGNEDAEGNVAYCLSAFNILGWLMEPIMYYLDEYAGRPAAPEGPANEKSGKEAAQ